MTRGNSALAVIPHRLLTRADRGQVNGSIPPWTGVSPSHVLADLSRCVTTSSYPDRLLGYSVGTTMRAAPTRRSTTKQASAYHRGTTPVEQCWARSR